MRRFDLLCAAAVFSMSAPMPAQTPVAPSHATGPKFDDALTIAQAAIAACRAKGDHVAALVVDTENVPVVLFADDGAVALAQQFAPRKAALALRYRAPSAVTAERAKNDATLAAEIKADPKIGFALPGAYPLIAGGEQVGALAVSGGSSPAADDACAQAAVAKASVHKR